MTIIETKMQLIMINEMKKADLDRKEWLTGIHIIV